MQFKILFDLGRLKNCELLSNQPVSSNRLGALLFQQQNGNYNYISQAITTDCIEQPLATPGHIQYFHQEEQVVKL